MVEGFLLCLSFIVSLIAVYRLLRYIKPLAERSYKDRLKSLIEHAPIGMNIADQKSAEKLALQSDKLAMVGQLAAGVAHEIRNPLTSLKGFLKLLAENVPDQDVYIQIMENELERIELISGQMLMLAKPQTETFRLHDLNQIIRDVVRMVHPETLSCNVSLDLDLHGKEILLVCEDSQVKQVLLNLLRNAMDAMPTGGTVRLETRVLEDYTEIHVDDTGHGMDEETLSRLGEPFYTTKGTGTGLGLMVTHRIVERHGGTVQYESEIGQGTRVTISFDHRRQPTPTKQVG